MSSNKTVARATDERWLPNSRHSLRHTVQNVLCVTQARLPSDLEVYEKAGSSKNMSFGGVRFTIKSLLMSGVKRGQLNHTGNRVEPFRALYWQVDCVFRRQACGDVCGTPVEYVAERTGVMISACSLHNTVIIPGCYLQRSPFARPGRMRHLSSPRCHQYDRRWFAGWIRPVLMPLP